jgi:hypothetical protein
MLLPVFRNILDEPISEGRLFRHFPDFSGLLEKTSFAERLRSNLQLLPAELVNVSTLRLLSSAPPQATTLPRPPRKSENPPSPLMFCSLRQ